MDNDPGKREKKKVKPPTVQKTSLQYDLFTSFLGDSLDLSNTIELWDAVPKYFVSRQKQDQMRDEKGRLPVLERLFVHGCAGFAVAIQPAAIKGADGVYRDYYPSVTEELIEDVLKKFFTDQKAGFHDVDKSDSWVRFTLQQIRRELAKRDKARSIDEIKHSLEVLSQSVIKLYIDGRAMFVNPILPTLMTVNRQDYVDDPGAMWMANLSTLISKSINDLSYRQYNYGRMISFKTQLARWLHKRLSHFYTNASITIHRRMLLTDLKQNSGLLEYKRLRDTARNARVSLDELVANSVLTSYAEHKTLEGRKLVDIEFNLCPHPDFVKEIKAANRRAKDARAKLKKQSQGGRYGSRKW